jgi:peptidoglycan hydrolase-like protein with peptidoglycan-binding domain
MHKIRTLGTPLAIASILTATLAGTTAARADGTTTTTTTTTKVKAPRGDVEVQATVGSSALSGESAETIKQVQRGLASRGLYQGKIDGVAGLKTEAALRNFQVQQGLPTGGLDQRTANALGVDGKRQPVAGTQTERAETGTAAPSTNDQRVVNQKPPVAGMDMSTLSAEQIKQVQQYLQQVGYYRGEIDGVMGARTRAALQRFFQHQSQLAAQGKIGEPVLGLFGLQAQQTN